MMKVEKKVISNLNKCYALAPLRYQGRDCFLVAAEKHDPCYVFSADGEQLETVWEEPGGVMTMQQVPGSDGAFLATHKFYSPNDSKEAKIVIAEPRDGKWEIRTLCDAPFVHRFGILRRGGVNWLIVCCLKSGHEYKEDWRFPGATYAAVLPEDLSAFNSENQLKLTLLKEGMLRNHGFSKYVDQGVETALVGCESGVYQFIPPETPGGAWQIRQLISDPSSDAVLLDFDGDGKPELGSISPFHGDTLNFYRLGPNGTYQLEYTYPEKLEFLHATWACEVLGKPTWVIGHRKGAMESMLVTWENGGYRFDAFDAGRGAANALMLDNGVLVMTNRETDEVAMYTFREE